MPSDKLFGRYDDLVRLLLGFALTGLLGTYLAQTYTTRQANLAASQKIFSDQSALIGKRYFVMNQITIAYEDNRDTPGTWKSEDVTTRWNAYRTVRALRGNTAEALAKLREAEQTGWRCLWRYYRDFDPNLASIHDEPEFKAVFTDIERDMAEQRARLAARPKDAPLELMPVRRATP